MSGVWGWFGGGASQKRKDAPKNAILGLRAHLEMLQKREQHLETQIQQQDDLARKNVTSNKNAAKAALRRKKVHEATLEKTQAQIITLENEINAIESANINRETLAVMEKAASAMKQIHSGLTPESRRQHNLSDEIATAITSNVVGEQVDDADLENELEALQQEQMDEKMLQTGTVPVSDAVHRLPAVANGEIKKAAPAKVQEDDEEEELRKLQAEMAM